jgi:succinyl-CoA synthetase alpha subunit
MLVKGITKQGEYFDSVSLMRVARTLTDMPGVLDAAVVMGTAENKGILEASEFLVPEFHEAGDTDLLIGIKAERDETVQAAVKQVEQLLEELRHVQDHGFQGSSANFLSKSFEGALKTLPEANVALISVAGKYAANEAMKALKQGLHVMIFSDNVPVEQEVELKTYARDNGLLVMGPDCGTAILNGIPLAFANVVQRGNIGVVAASGTGLQEVSCVISQAGAGISQAIGTGGRDVQEAIGGIMFLEALKALRDDEHTQVIVLISKPPHKSVLSKIAEEIRQIKKPVIAICLGADPETLRAAGAIPARTLEEAGLLAAALSQEKKLDSIKASLESRTDELKTLAAQEAEKRQPSQQYISGLFSGGTLCDEAQLILRNSVGNVYSNTPLTADYKLDDPSKDRDHTILDLGDDEFTVGRPHPMIDFSLRKKRLLEEARDAEVAVILLDVVLGYGAHPNPAEELGPVITEAKALAAQAGRYLNVVCSITGTDQDPQGKQAVKRALQDAGAFVMESNAAACELAGYLC